MIEIKQQLPELFLLLDNLLKPLDEKKKNSVYKEILGTINSPQVSDHMLETIIAKMMAIGTDYDHFVSVYIFIKLPDDYTKMQFQQLQDELFHFIEKEYNSKNLDKKFTQKLIELTELKFPQLNKKQVVNKALGNWAWLLPHAYMMLVIEKILKIVSSAVLDDKMKNRKGRIRIKKI